MTTKITVRFAALVGVASASAASGSDAAQPGLASPTAQRQSIVHYRDGSYTAVGQYGNLPSFLTVSVDVRDDRIVRTVVKTHATDPTSLDYQRRFGAAVPAAVVGKPLSEVKVGRLAGSSGCPIGFNAALDQIRAKAER
jgi:uncharacterized protein with FMN-binding domain